MTKEQNKPTIIEVYSDNGLHSHWALVDLDSGKKIWSENPEGCKAMGFPVFSPSDNSIEIDTQELKKIVATAMHKELIIVNVGTADNPDYDIKGQGLVLNYLDNCLVKPKSDDPIPSVDAEKIKELVLEAYKKENVVYSTIEGLETMPLKEFVKQPVEGLLYDLNKNELTALAFIKDPRWVNDFAVAKVIKELKDQLELNNKAYE